MEVKCKEAGQERDQLRNEVDELQTAFAAQKNELEELRAGFTTEKKDLDEDYKKQVDEMFFFSYQCCMRKNYITHDIPSYHSDEKDAIVSGPAQGDKDLDTVGPSNGL